MDTHILRICIQKVAYIVWFLFRSAPDVIPGMLFTGYPVRLLGGCGCSAAAGGCGVSAEPASTSQPGTSQSTSRTQAIV